MLPDPAVSTTAENPVMESVQAASTVLIVDDSIVVQDRLFSMLSDLSGLTVVGTAEEAVQAIGEIQRLEPDIVVLDLQLKTGSGLEVLETIRTACPEMLVIMLTNFSHELLRQRCLEKGANFFLDKSLEFNRIPGLIHHYTQRGTG